MLSTDYWVLYSAFLVSTANFLAVRDPFVRILAVFFLVYFGVACLNVVEYRGMISAPTMRAYGAFCLTVLTIMTGFALARRNVARRASRVGQYERAKGFRLVAGMHLLVLVGTMLVAVLLYGNVLINQDTRFIVPAAMQYVLKSGAVIPLVYFGARGRTTLRSVAVYGILPLIPILFIGGRAVLIVSVLSVLAFLGLKYRDHIGEAGESERMLPTGKTLLMLGAIGFVVVYGLFYLRRYNSDVLVAFSVLHEAYFPDIPYWVALLFAPVFTGLRETTGLTQSIIDMGLSNTILPYPILLADFATVLPGSQLAAGNALAQMLGSDPDVGLTPGLVGGLYLDLGSLAWIGGAFGITALGAVYAMTPKSDAFKLLAAYGLGQWLHLVHRGFLKPEYFTSLVILLVYMMLVRWVVARSKEPQEV